MERRHQPRQVHKEVEDNLNFYTERATNFIYEAAFYDDYVLVRPASPMFYNAIRQMTWPEFASEFSEFLGDHLLLRRQLNALEGIEGEDDEKEDLILFGG